MGFWSNLFRRQFRNASTSEQLLREIYAGAPASSGVSVSADSAMRCATVYACVRVLAESLAQLPLITYRRTADGGKERAADHELFVLLNSMPNEWQTSFEFREMLMGHLCLRGNAYSLVSRIRAGQVAELIPLHPDRVTVKQLSDYSLVYVLRGSDGSERPLGQDEVMHLRGLSCDGVKGMSPITVAREAVGLAIAAERYGGKMYSNGARLSGILKHPSKLSAEAANRLRASFEDVHAGVENAHKAALLEEGMDWVSVGMTAKDSEFLTTRKYQRGEIASIFRVPPHKIGDLERATFSNIEHQSLEFVQDTMLPWARRWEQAITRDLIAPAEREGIFAEFLFDGLLRGDAKTRYEAYGSAISNGWMTRNEVRVKENLNPEDGLDEFLTPLNMRQGAADPKEQPNDPPNQPESAPAAAA